MMNYKLAVSEIRMLEMLSDENLGVTAKQYSTIGFHNLRTYTGERDSMYIVCKQPIVLAESHNRTKPS